MPVLGFLLWGIGVLVVAAGLVALDRAWLRRTTVDPSDPAVRVAGAVRSISGSDSVRRATYDDGTHAVRVEVSSRYYDAARRIEENREHLATEGRMGAQLALHDNPTVKTVTIVLYTRRTLLADVTARQGQAFAQMLVEFHGPLGSAGSPPRPALGQ
ncbi:MAG TPA: hypothetical protein VFM39_02690 [bacterium]|nr:hypothetical protein [bacterium]